VDQILTPSYLKPGDTVGILCTARAIQAEDLKPSIELLKSWGLNVKLGNTIGKQDHQMGGTDAEKIADIQAMIEDDRVQCIWCARGGYGTVRIIDKIDFAPLIKNPKWIVGFSDITVLHSHLSQRVKMANRDGSAKGILCGGNLSLLYSLLGSVSEIDTKGKILFLEDLDEYLYHVDRMIMALKRAGKLEGLAGLVVGGLTDMNDNEVPFGASAQEIIANHTAEYSYPICFNFPSGHQAENLALIFGRSARLRVDGESVELNLD